MWLSLFAELVLCPSPWRVTSRISLQMLMFIRLQVLCLTWTAHHVAQLKAVPCSRLLVPMSDSSVEEEPPAGITTPPGWTTPPGRPITTAPAGPPPPRPVQEQQTLAHRISAAVAWELGFQGDVLTYIPWDVATITRLVVSIRSMRPHERQHPNILEYRDSPQPEESDHGELAGDHMTDMNTEEGVEAATLETDSHSEEHGSELIAYESSDPEAVTGDSRRIPISGPREPLTPPPHYNANAATASTTTTWTPGQRNSRVNEIISRMEMEGRAMMTEAEVQALTAEFEAAPLEENATLSYEALFEEGTEDAEENGEADETEATASTMPTSTSSTTPQPKPKGNQFRKRSPQLFSPSAWYIFQLGIVCCGCWLLCCALACAYFPCTCRGESGTHEPRIQACSSQIIDTWKWHLQGFLTSSTSKQWSWPTVLQRSMYTNFCALLENMSSRPLPLCNRRLRIFYSGIVLSALVRYSKIYFDHYIAGTLPVLRSISNRLASVLFTVPLVVRLVYGLARKTTQAKQTSEHKLFQYSTAIHTMIRSMPGFRNTSTSRTGPKSGRTSRHVSCALPLYVFILLICVLPCQTARTDVRVGGPSTVPPEVPSGTKPRGLREASVPTQEHSDIDRITKRTYGRAYAKAARQGGSYYRGRWREFQWFRKTRVHPIQLPRQAVPESTTHCVRTMTWNAGGLTKPVLQELETYARDMRLDVIHIQETKWSEDYNWSGPDYVYVHSAGQNKLDKVGGLLTMISTRIASSQDVQYNSAWAGRLLHVRIPAGNASLDLLNAYQYSANDKPGTAARRQQFLQKLQRLIAGLPRRNALILSGDMNTSCEPMPHVSGPYVLPVGEYHKQDYKDFLHICEALSLIILNTWNNPKHGQIATFKFGQLSSQIDYIIVRRPQASNTARRAAVMADYPVAQWREGANHYPVMAYVPVPKRPWKTPDPGQ